MEIKTYNDGGNFFTIKISKNIAQIISIYTNESLVIEYLNVILGEDDEYGTTSVIFELIGGEYLFVGAFLFRFTAKSEIINLIATVDRHWTYPYAMDREDNVYLLIEKVCFKNPGIDPYEWYYDNYLITKDMAFESKLPKHNFEGIDAWYVYNTQYTMKYDSRRYIESDFESLKNGEQDDDYEYPTGIFMHILLKDGRKKALSCIEYRGIMKRFANIIGIYNL